MTIIYVPGLAGARKMPSEASVRKYTSRPGQMTVVLWLLPALVAAQADHIGSVCRKPAAQFAEMVLRPLRCLTLDVCLPSNPGVSRKLSQKAALTITPKLLEMDDIDATLSRLIIAFHILHQQRIFDEHGHVSVRNPTDSSTFFTSNVPALLVSSKTDLNQWNVSDGTPVLSPHFGCRVVHVVPHDSEHHIHSSIYNLYPGVHSVVHSQSLSSIVFGLCNSAGSMLQPTYHMAGFLGPQCPIFDAAHHYSALPSTHPRNLLINHKHLGDALARTFSSSPEGDGIVSLPDHTAVFQRGHGFVTWATGIEEAVYRAIHVQRNADIQTVAMNQRDQTALEIVYLSEREAKDSQETINRPSRLIWSSWVAHAERSGLYHNDLRWRGI